jgi:CSLREA domain-containing protein
MRRVAFIAAIVVVAALSVPALAEAASTFTVTTTTDSDDGSCTPALCSFRDALNAAQSSPGSTVIVPAGTYKGAMLGGNGVWAPDGQYTIQGAGAGKTIIDGNQLARTFAFYGQITVIGVTVTGGHNQAAGCECGAGFEVRQGGFLTLIDSVVTGNVALSNGGGIDVDSQSKAILQNDVISQNSAPGNGAGIHVSPVSGNTGTLEMTNVTISGNTTIGSASGGGLDNQGSTTGTNVTFAGNFSAADGGGVMNESGGTLALVDSTIATNGATGSGAGIRNLGSMTVRNTIVADGCSGTVTSQGHNLDAGKSCSFGATGDLTGMDPKLGPLADNGGNTGVTTLALQAGSPAIDAGDNAACPTTDARGITRPQHGICDIGAVEYAPPTVALGTPAGITSNAAVLNGTVNPNLRDTTVTFQYGTTTAYGSSTSATDVGAGGSATGTTAHLSGLKPGTTYHYRLVGTNGDGTGSTADATFTTARGAPTLTNVGQSAKRWSERKQRHRKKPPVGTTFSFTLDQGARVTFAFTQPAAGRRVHGKCVPQTKRNKHKPRCHRTLTRATLRMGGKAGKNSLKFNGRAGSHTLKPGKYTVVITAVNSSGQASSPKTLTFTIVRH